MANFRPGLAAMLLGAFTILAAPAYPDTALTEKAMTKVDFDRLVKVERDGETDVGPEPVHDPGQEGRKKLKETGGTKIIDGEEWQKMTPEERRDRILDLTKTMLAPGLILIVIIPRGDVYALPPEKSEELRRLNLIRPWVNSDYVELPDGPVRLQGKRGDREREPEADEPDDVP